jgi:hypothetical protein
MLSEIDAGLRSLLLREVVDGDEVTLAFDAPTREWAAGRNAPTLDLYLYDIREDLGSRVSGECDVRDDNGRIVGREPPPRTYRLSYLVTAWTSRPEDEHRLLDRVLACLVRHSAVPPDDLSGALAGWSRPVLLSVAVPPTHERSISEMWTALGGVLKPSLDLVVSAPLRVADAVSAAPLVREPLDLRVNGDESRAETRPGIGT